MQFFSHLFLCAFASLREPVFVCRAKTQRRKELGGKSQKRRFGCLKPNFGFLKPNFGFLKPNFGCHDPSFECLIPSFECLIRNGVCFELND